MKNLFLLLCTLGLLTLGLFSCNHDDDDDALITLPATIENYLTDNYPDYSVDESEEETLCDGTVVYEVELENDNDDELELTFDLEGNLLFSETEIDNSELPAAINNSISTNYADYQTEEAERLDMADGTTRYEVELENGDSELEVLFEADGTVICEEEDE